MKITIHESSSPLDKDSLKEMVEDTLGRFSQVVDVVWSDNDGKPKATVLLYSAIHDSAENLRDMFVRTLGGESVLTGIARPCTDDEKTHADQWCINLLFK